VRRKHWTTVAEVKPGTWLATCDCGTWEATLKGLKGNAVELAREHQIVAEYQEKQRGFGGFQTS
jgi:hypothetical protein